MKIRKGIAALGMIAAGLTTLAASPAMASDVAPDVETDPGTVVIDGREYGPEDGLTVTNESFEIQPGRGESVGELWATTPDPGSVGTLATWGSSYAISDEYAYLFYRGKAKAAANVYNGERIIKVCIQYTRSGNPVADQRCSTATSNGSRWTAGPEVLSYATDSPELVAPPTIFNIQTTRINPQIL